MRVIIIDDEVLARKRILKLLEPHQDVKVVGECRNAREGIELIERKSPDLVFLDIQMPGMDGFAMIEHLHTRMPYIIFATAYNQYALEAFNVHAVDYLLKPFDEQRFDEALNQARNRLRLEETESFKQKMLGLIKAYSENDQQFLDIFHFKFKGREKRISSDEIYYIEAAGNYVALHLEQEKHLYRITMNELEDQLDPDSFLRIHRSYILNRIYIKSYRYLSNNEFKFKMKNDHELISGRAYKEHIGEFLEVMEARS